MKGPIGIFDSGIGGLTVVKELTRILPSADLIYFGDTARVPYGTRSVKLIRQYAMEDAAFLRQYGIAYLIVACNTASAVAIDLLESTLDIPVTGVIVPGVNAALEKSRNKRIGVIGTTATVNSQAYNKKINAIDPEAVVIGQPCPILVPLVEEGWIDEEITRLTVRKYLAPLLVNEIDTIILGCTHFPVIKKLIQEEAGPDIVLIDSGQEAAKIVRQMVGNGQQISGHTAKGQFKCYVSDIPDKFDEVGTRFLGEPLVNAERVDFEAFLMKMGKNITYA